MKIHGQKKVSDIITNVARFIPEEDLVEINKGMKKYTDLQLGELTEDGGTELRDLLAKDISEAGKTLAVMSQARKLIDGGIVAAGDKSKRTYEDDIADAVREQNKMKKSEPLKYGQSVWKRLLVSSPSSPDAVSTSAFPTLNTSDILDILPLFDLPSIANVDSCKPNTIMS